MGKQGKGFLFLILLSLASCTATPSADVPSDPGVSPSRSKTDGDKTEIVFWKRRGPKRMWA